MRRRRRLSRGGSAAEPPQSDGGWSPGATSQDPPAAEVEALPSHFRAVCDPPGRTRCDRPANWPTARSVQCYPPGATSRNRKRQAARGGRRRRAQAPPPSLTSSLRVKERLRSRSAASAGPTLSRSGRHAKRAGARSHRSGTAACPCCDGSRCSGPEASAVACTSPAAQRLRREARQPAGWSCPRGVPAARKLRDG